MLSLPFIGFLIYNDLWKIIDWFVALCIRDSRSFKNKTGSGSVAWFAYAIRSKSMFGRGKSTQYYWAESQLRWMKLGSVDDSLSLSLPLSLSLGRRLHWSPVQFLIIFTLCSFTLFSLFPPTFPHAAEPFWLFLFFQIAICIEYSEII